MEVILVILFEFSYVGSINTEGCDMKAKSDYILKDAHNNELRLFYSVQWEREYLISEMYALHEWMFLHTMLMRYLCGCEVWSCFQVFVID